MRHILWASVLPYACSEIIQNALMSAEVVVIGVLCS